MRVYSDVATRYLSVQRSRTLLTMLGIILAIGFFAAMGTVYTSYVQSSIQGFRSRADYEVSYQNLNHMQVQYLTGNVEVSSSGVILRYPPHRFGEDLLQITEYDTGAMEVFRITPSQGRVPTRSGEVMVEARLGLDLGEALVLEDEVLQVVGIFEPAMTQKGLFQAIRPMQTQSPTGYEAYVNLRQRRGKVDLAQRVGEAIGASPEQIGFNEGLLKFYGQSQDPIIDRRMQSLIAGITALILLCTIAGVYNAFTIAVVERSRYFGLLRAIGATPRQIRKIVGKEALFMGLIAIPIGIASGFGLLFLIQRGLVLVGLATRELSLSLHPVVVLVCLLLGGVTILFSVWGPAHLASKVTPVEAIRNSVNIKRERIRPRSTRLIRRLFGFEGELGYKYIRRNPKEFWVTIFSLTISVVLFITLTSLVHLAWQMEDWEPGEAVYDSRLVATQGKIALEVLDELRRFDGIAHVYSPWAYRVVTALEGVRLHPSYQSSRSGPITIADGRFQYTSEVSFWVFDPESLEAAKPYLMAGSMEHADLERGVLMVQGYDPAYTDYALGDLIRLPRLGTTSGEESRQEVINRHLRAGEYDLLEVVGILSQNPFAMENEALALIFTTSHFERIVGEVGRDLAYIRFQSEADRLALAGVLEGLDGLWYLDLHQSREEFYHGMAVYYTVVIILVLVGVLSIINTLSINLLVKGRELAILGTIGMNRPQFRRFVLWQGLLYGLMATTVGGGAGLLIALAIKDGLQPMTEARLGLPLGMIATGLTGVLVVNLLAAHLPLPRLRKVEVTQALSQE